MTTFDFDIVVPVRGGSKRVPHKNVRPFAGVQGGLLELKLRQLLSIPGEPKIYLTTDDPEAIAVGGGLGSDRVVIDRRPEALCRSDTRIEDLIAYIGRLGSRNHIFWLHVTSPFVETPTYIRATETYADALAQGHDSLMSVTALRQFIWNPKLKDVINRGGHSSRWPQTQDLDPLYIINHAFYINSRANYASQGDRIGRNPYCFELHGLEQYDIDWEDDFEMAERIYEGNKVRA